MARILQRIAQFSPEQKAAFLAITSNTSRDTMIEQLQSQLGISKEELDEFRSWFDRGIADPSSNECAIIRMVSAMARHSP